MHVDRMSHLAPLVLLVTVPLGACYAIEQPSSHDVGEDDEEDGVDVALDLIPDPDVVEEEEETDLPAVDVAGEEPSEDPVTEEPEVGIVGDPCYSSTQCPGVPGAGRICLTSIMGYITFPGGYCSASCTTDGDCGPWGDCVDLVDLGHYCLKRCTLFGDQCRIAEGYQCATVITEQTYCIPVVSSPEGSDY